MLARDLLFVVVRDRRAVVHRAEAVDGAGVEQEGRGQLRLAGAAVSHQRDITDLIRIVHFHGSAILLARKSSPAAPIAAQPTLPGIRAVPRLRPRPGNRRLRLRSPPNQPSGNPRRSTAQTPGPEIVACGSDRRPTNPGAAGPSAHPRVRAPPQHAANRRRRNVRPPAQPCLDAGRPRKTYMLRHSVRVAQASRRRWVRVKKVKRPPLEVSGVAGLRGIHAWRQSPGGPVREASMPGTTRKSPT